MKEIKVGIVGSGFIAGVHCDAIAQIGHAKVTAHCDTDQDRGQAFIKDRKIDHSYPDHQSLFKEADIDAVIIGVPNCHHAAIAIAAAQAGKHIIVEKPLCLTLDQADAILDAAKKTASWSAMPRSFVSHLNSYAPKRSPSKARSAMSTGSARPRSTRALTRPGSGRPSRPGAES